VTSTKTPRHPDTLPVAAVVVPPERRARANPQVVQLLAESIDRRGLMTPIRVRRDGRLVCGLHRLLAHELLGRVDIEVVYVEDDATDIDTELDEIEENLCRRDLSVLERALHEQRRHVLYEQLKPETRRGVAGGRARHGQQPKSISFAQAEAKPGSGERMVQQRVQIADRLGTDAVQLLDHPIASNHTQLLALARVPDALRHEVVERIASGEAATVEVVLKSVTTGEPAAPKTKKIISTTGEFPVVKADDGYSVRAELRGRVVNIAFTSDLKVCSVSDGGGLEPVVPTPKPVEDDRLLTFQNSLAVPDELVRELPSDLAPYVTLSPIHIEEDTECPACGGHTFFVEERSQELHCDGCVPYYKRLACCITRGRLRVVTTPRISRRIIVQATSGQTVTIVIRWWNPRDWGERFRPVRIEIDGDYGFELAVEAPWGCAVQKFKNLLAARVLGELRAGGHFRWVGDRRYRDDGTEVVLTPILEPVTECPVVEVKQVMSPKTYVMNNLGGIADAISRTCLRGLGWNVRPKPGEVVDYQAAEGVAASRRKADVRAHERDHDGEADARLARLQRAIETIESTLARVREYNNVVMMHREHVALSSDICFGLDEPTSS
jgi:ParB family chromosome partitioning protein